MRDFSMKKCVFRLLAILIMACQFAFLMPENVKLPFSEEITRITLAEAGVKLNASSVVLTPGKKYVIAISGDKRAYTWTSSNTKVATVKRASKKYKATVTAKSEGTAIITASKGSTTFQCKVVVMAKTSTEPETTGESIDKSKSFKDITVFETKGTATVVRTQSTKKQKTIYAEKDMKLLNQDLLSVGKQSLLRMVLDDKEFIYLEENSQAAISKGWFNKCNVVLVKGEMVAEVQKKLGDGETLNIQTPNTTMSIRGTVVAVKTEVKKDGTIESVNYVLQGSADVKVLDPKTNKYGKTVSLSAGEGVKVVTDNKGEAVKSEKATESDLKFKDIDVQGLKGAGSDDAGNGSNGKSGDVSKDMADKYGITGSGTTKTISFGNRNSDSITVENVYKIGFAAVGKVRKVNTHYMMPGTSGWWDDQDDNDEENVEVTGYVLNDSQGIPVFYVSGKYAEVTVKGSLSNYEWTMLEKTSGTYSFDTTMQTVYGKNPETISGTGYAMCELKVNARTREPENGAVELKEGVWMAPERQSFVPCLIVVGEP